MNKEVVHVEFVRERASATPARTAPVVARRPGPPVAPRIAPLSDAAATSVVESADRGSRLRRDQLWFARAVMTPESEASAVTAEEASRTLTAGPRLGALDRLEIYRRAYHARLVECLADDYPVLRHALGEAQFEELCRAYIALHPSEGPNLNFFGRGMATFCRQEAPASLPSRDFATDLASLEWAIVEVIHAPSSQPLTMTGLSEIPMEAWPAARLVPNTAFRLQRYRYPVNAYFQDVRAGGNPPLPEAAPSATVVYRSGPTVWRMDLTDAMFAVLSALAAGETLETSLSRAEPNLEGVDEDEAAQRVLAWFREWVASGLFVGVEV